LVLLEWQGADLGGFNHILYLPPFYYLTVMNPVNSQHIRQISFYILLVFLAVFLFLELSSFLPALLGAITFYVLMRKRMQKLVHDKKWSPGLAATVLLLLSFLIVLVPVGLFINIISAKVSYAVHHSNQVMDTLRQIIVNQEKNFNVEILNEENTKKISLALANFLPSVVGATVNSVTTIIMMYLLLYFMLVSSKSMEKWLQTYIPMKERNVYLIGGELNKLVISNAVGIPLTALVQGLVALLGYWVAGVHDLGFWFVFTCITSMVPMVGLGMSYIPISILLFAEGESTKAVLLILYCALIVGSADNVFRFALQKKLGDVHPLVTIFGVIIGLKIFGFIGLIFGPILIALFILLIRIYVNEFNHVDSFPNNDQIEN
jgi:predicted PurR-regulated permease PerM